MSNIYDVPVGSFHAEPTVMVSGLPDLDRELYRIFPLWFFEAALRVNAGNLFLVRPSVWEDPFEDVCSKMAYTTKDYRQVMLAQYLNPVYAQCWSLEGKSDALVRAYSRVSKDPATNRNIEPRYEGVQVKTTPRKLVIALNRFQEKRNDSRLKFYLGAVQYVDNVAGEIGGILNNVGPIELGKGDNRAASLLKKRKAFKHEAEVRIILVASPDINLESMYIDIDCNEVFDEVYFDPRLATFERLEREKLTRDLGYLGKFGDNASYQMTLFNIMLDNPKWDILNDESVS